MKYSELAELYEKLENTSKNLEKTKLISEFLKKISSENIKDIILLLQGKVFPDYSDKEIGVANNLVVKLLKTVSGINNKEIEQTWNKTGDLGLTAQEVLKKKKQATLKTKELELNDVINSIRNCAEITGNNAISKKLNSLSEILSFATPKEAKYIVRTILNTLRVGVAFGILRDSVSQAFNVDKKLIQKKFDLTNDLGEIALILKTKGETALKSMSMSIGTPLRSELYMKEESIKTGFERVGKPAILEFKYDGMRMQVHKDKDEIMLFTRRLDNVTRQFPEIVKTIRENVKAEKCVLDSEAIAYNTKTNVYLPFQILSKRIKRKYRIEEMVDKIPVVLYVFDILNYDDKNVMKENRRTRRGILEKIIKPKKWKIELAEQLITSSENPAEKFYQKALLKHAEGIIMKNIETEYKPGRKVGYGVKIKPVMETLDLMITGAVWGEGKRGKWFSSFILSCRKGEEYMEIGKMGSGFTEEQFAELTERLKKIIIKKDGRNIFVKPEVIVEVAYEEIQKSPSYNSGYALRFPRLVRIRSDKEDADEIEKVNAIYASQKKSS